MMKGKNTGYNVKLFLTEKGISIAMIALTIIAIFRATRFTSIWAVTHYYFNYDFGFIKRGLFGSIFSLIFGSAYYSYTFVYILTLLIMIGSIILLLYIFKKAIDNEKTFLFIAILFLTSTNFAYYIHIIGYYDQLGLLFMLVLYVLMPHMKKNIFALLVILSTCFLIFVHEVLIILYGVPAFLLVLYSITNKDEEIKISIKKMLKAFLIIIVPVAISLFVVLNYGTAEKKVVSSLKHDLQQKTSFNLRNDAFVVLNRSGEDNIQEINKKRNKEGKNYFEGMVYSFILYFPAVIVLLLFGIGIIRKSKVKYKLLFIFYFVAGTFSPLIIHLFGWDVNRWNSDCLFTSLLSLIIIKKILLPFQSDEIDKKWYSLAFLIIIITINLISVNHFFDNYSLMPYPFKEHMYYLRDLLFKGGQFPIIPNV